MLDFLQIAVKSSKKGVVDIYPRFMVIKSSDLMIRGGDFYAIWMEEEGLWSTDELDAIRLIDKELDKYAQEHSSQFEDSVIRVLHMWDSDSRMIDKWHKYCKNDLRDSYSMLDEKIIFSNMTTKKKDYASKKLPYPLESCATPAYDELMSVLYSPEEREKIEWSIGSIITGDSKRIQKFIVLYGSAGTGKSTVLNIIQQLFEGYYSVFDAKALGSSSNVFALEAFRTNPLVSIQHDGDLSRIEDNTRLNSLVSHEQMTVNEKFKTTYSTRFNAFLFMGTNKPVKITDGKSGLLRRLIDVTPTGEKVHYKTYQKLVNQISFELGGIAYHCKQVYLNDPSRYNNYVPTNMLGASNDFYNFVEDSYDIFEQEEMIPLKQAWEMYKKYCDEAKVSYILPMRAFKEELKNYFRTFDDRARTEDGLRVRNVYSGFLKDKFTYQIDEPEPKLEEYLIKMTKRKSIFDKLASEYPAQLATKDETPSYKWSNVRTTLKDIDTSKVHYVKVPTNHIVIDFDLKGEDGKKSLQRNLIEASKWPTTYAELSKSGEGVHLHYIYEGDPKMLSRIYDDNIEIKVFTGNSSLRRKLTKCNGENIATISSGLPMKGEKQMINFESFENEQHLRALIKKNLRKEIHANTKPSVIFIKDSLDEAYSSGMSYDVSDMRNSIFKFAACSTNNKDFCLDLYSQMKFKSKDKQENKEGCKDGTLVFYDVEVFPNLIVVVYKLAGKKNSCVRMINPKPDDIAGLLQMNLVGFNCRRYDNHILYALLLGESIKDIYKRSQRIINKDKTAFFGEAYNLSYTDVFDFSSDKTSLKKFEIELGIHHQELGLPWDKPVPEDMWIKVAEYCDNDVIATEAVFNARKADWTARQILADVAGMTVNDTTNSLTTRIIFGTNRNPQDEFNYRNLGEYSKDKPYFPGYSFDDGISSYRDVEKVGEGGYVYSEPGMYGNVALLDIASMHPTSIVQENLFGDRYTAKFKELLDARIAIKHSEFDKARKMLGGKLALYLEDESTAKDLSQALKIAINSVYGLTSASFENPFRDIRNIDNIVAKRGALFMIDLRNFVQEKGYTVAHIKTDSIKIPDADPEIIKAVMDFGKKYGYTFEHEATYDRMCLVNDAVYIAKYKDGGWTATGTQFQIPYVFKKLFSKERVIFKDLCETKSVTTAIYLAKDPEDLSTYQFVGKVGQFCPMKEGTGGGVLFREKDGKYNAVTGTKGYLWMESEQVKFLQKEKDIDKTYYDRLVDEAVESISKLGDFEWFISDEPYISPPFVGGKMKGA